MKNTISLVMVLASAVACVSTAAEDPWTSIRNMPTARMYLSTSVVNGKIYAIGGGPRAQSSVSAVEEYDPATKLWTTRSPMKTPRFGLTTSVVNGKIYAIGGAQGGPPGLGTVEEYDPVTDTWTTKSSMPTVRFSLSSSMVNGKIYVIGGSTAGFPWSPALAMVEEYDPHPLVVDFNGDRKVDSADMCLMVDFWHTDEPFYDIAPHPFGDGIVDVQDLILLAEHLFQDYRLVAHVALDETEGNIAYDIAGINDGVLNGEPLWQSTEGMVDGALQLDGINDYVTTKFVLNPTEGPFSIFAWIKGGAPGQVIISQADITFGRVNDPGSAWLGVNPSNAKLMSRLMDAFPALESESEIVDGQWHHVGLVYDCDQLHRYLYVDGIQVAKDTDVVGGVDSTGGLHIGAGKNLDPSSFFSGLIDDIRIYSVVLTPEQIEWLAR